jgi:hypothetical protein
MSSEWLILIWFALRRLSAFDQPLLRRMSLYSLVAHLEILHTILWQIWEHRNNFVFRDKTSTMRAMLSKVVDDLYI